MIDQIKIKVVILGSHGVGKTCILNIYIYNKYDPNTETTIGSSYTNKYEDIPSIDKPINFQIWDTAGHERYHSMTKTYQKGAKAALVVYDLNDHKSVQKLDDWINDLKNNIGDKIVIGIIGNKCDQFSNNETDISEANKYAENLGIKLFITSAKSGVGIKNVFGNIGREVIKRYKNERERNSVSLTNKQNNNSKCC